MKIGESIPELLLKDQHESEIKLRDLTGKKLVVYFYPKDDTPGCTAQACSIQAGEKLLMEKDITVIGISADSVTSHKKFSTKYHLSFPLLSDPEKKAIEAFGVWGPKKFMGKTYNGIHRKSFLFDASGTLIHIIEKPDTKNHAEEILDIFTKIQST